MRHLTKARLDTAPMPRRQSNDIAAVAKAALLAELNTWPKPGLVSHIDNGSHADMDARSFEVSAEAIAPFFALLAAAGAEGANMPVLREIGVQAERAMLAATGGVNTHRGAIFGLGLLCAAAGASGPKVGSGSALATVLADMVHVRWGGSILRGPIPLRSHGTEVWRRFGAGGARAQAAAGFPHVLEIALPALRAARLVAPADAEAWRVQAFFALLEAVEDTNLLYRAGSEGLCFARAAAERFLADGGISQVFWRNRAAAVHRSFVARQLSPGGCADLLAIAVFLDTFETGR